MSPKFLRIISFLVGAVSQLLYLLSLDSTLLSFQPVQALRQVAYHVEESSESEESYIDRRTGRRVRRRVSHSNSSSALLAIDMSHQLATIERNDERRSQARNHQARQQMLSNGPAGGGQGRPQAIQDRRREEQLALRNERQQDLDEADRERRRAEERSNWAIQTVPGDDELQIQPVHDQSQNPDYDDYTRGQNQQVARLPELPVRGTASSETNPTTPMPQQSQRRPSYERERPSPPRPGQAEREERRRSQGQGTPRSSSPYPVLGPLPQGSDLELEDDVIISGSLRYQGRDLMGERARIKLWDEKHGVWAIRLGATGEVVGSKSEKLWKIRKVSLADLPPGGIWAVIAGSERAPEGGNEEEGDEGNLPEEDRPPAGVPLDKLIDLPKGVEVKMDLESGRKLVRRAAGSSPGRDEL